MADDVTRSIEEALNEIVDTTDQSGNMRKELKRAIYEHLSTLRILFVEMQATLKEGTRQKERKDREMQPMKAELDASRRANNNTKTERQLETSREKGRIPQQTTSRHVLPPHNYPKRYSDAAAGREEKKFKLSLTTKGSHTPDEIKRLLKAKVNPTEINVGILSLKTLRDGRILVEAGSNMEIEVLGEKIQERCGEEMETNIQKLRNPRIVMLNIPSDVTLENVKETLTQQNTELNLRRENGPKI